MEGEFSSDDDGESQPHQEQSTYCLSIEKQQSDCSVNKYETKKMCQFEKITVKKEEEVEEQNKGDQIQQDHEMNQNLKGFSAKFILEQYKQFQQTKKKQFLQTVSNEKPTKKSQKIGEILNEMLDKLELKNENIKEMCFSILKKVLSSPEEFKNKALENISMAIIVLACRNLQLPLSLKKITGLNKIESNLKEISQKCVNKCLKKIKKLFENSENQEIVLEAYDPAVLIQRIANLMSDKSQEVNNKMPKICELAKRIVQNLDNLSLKSSSHAITIAVCAFWISCSLQKYFLNLNDICTKIGINSQAIRNYYREIYPFRDFLVSGKQSVPQEVHEFIQKYLPMN